MVILTKDFDGFGNRLLISPHLLVNVFGHNRPGPPTTSQHDLGVVEDQKTVQCDARVAQPQ